MNVTLKLNIVDGTSVEYREDYDKLQKAILSQLTTSRNGNGEVIIPDKKNNVELVVKTRSIKSLEILF